MTDSIINQKQEKEITKTFKESFTDFLISFEEYFTSFGFFRKKEGHFIRLQEGYEEFFEIDGKNGSYLSFEILLGVRFKKFDKFYSNIYKLSFKTNETIYFKVFHEKNFKNYIDFKPYFYCTDTSDWEQATNTIKYVFENQALIFYKNNCTLLSIRDYILNTDISSQDYQFDRFQLPNMNAMSLVALVTLIYDNDNFLKIINSYKNLFEKTNDFKTFEDYYLTKLENVNINEAKKMIDF